MRIFAQPQGSESIIYHPSLLFNFGYVISGALGFA
jgi:hypothetical protein